MRVLLSSMGDWRQVRRQAVRVAAVGLGSARHLAEHLGRAVGPKPTGQSVDALAADRDTGVAVNRESGFRDSAPGPCWARWRRDGVLAWGFHATDLRNAEAVDAPRPAECCFSLDFRCAGTNRQGVGGRQDRARGALQPWRHSGQGLRLRPHPATARWCSMRSQLGAIT
jgi:hypothetical protein